MSDETTTPTRRKRVILRREPQPDGKILDIIARLEDHGVSYRWGEEPEELFQARLEAWKNAPARDRGEMPEPGDMMDIEDRSACDLEGMDLATCAEFLLMPGHVHGYGPSHLPSEPTRAPINSPERDRIYHRRLMRGEDLHHPNDLKHKKDL